MANIMKRNKDNGHEMTNSRSMMPFGGFVDSVLQNALKRFYDDDFWGFDGVVSHRSVPVNLRETDRSYEIDVVAPGMRKEDFNVHLSKNMLTVSFEHREEKDEENKGEGYLRQEYRLQSFSRSFTLDDTVDTEHIQAEYRDGVLRLSLPKKEDAQRLTRNIEIK